MSSLVFSSPVPSSLTPSQARRTTPAAIRAAVSIGCFASSLPASSACSILQRFTSAYCLRFGLLKPRLGMRMCSGIWPPSKPLMATPERDFWPFTPRPAVLPLPEPMPRPTRMRPLRAPSLSAIWFSFIVVPSAPGPGGASALFLFDAHQVLHLVDHAAHRRRVLEDGAAVALVQPQALQR